MDLNDIWQGNKRFILGVVGGLILLMIGKAIIKSTWDVDSVSRSVRGSNSNIARTEVPSQSDLSRIEGESARYQEVLDALYRDLEYVVAEDYRLPDRGAVSADLLYNDIREKATSALVDNARRFNIYVDSTLGLPPFTPSGREAIQRTLRGLNIVEQVVKGAVVAEVSAVDKIEILKPRIRRNKEGAFIDSLSVRFEISGSTASIADLVDRVVRDHPFLALETFEIERDDNQVFGVTRIKMEVAALSIEPEAVVTGGRS